MSATTSLEPTSLGGWCSCSSQRCLIVILLQTRVQVVYLCSYLLMSKAPTLSFGVSFQMFIKFSDVSPAITRVCHIQAAVTAQLEVCTLDPGASEGGFQNTLATWDKTQKNLYVNSEHRTKNLHWYMILQQSVFHWNASIESWMISFWKMQNASFLRCFPRQSSEFVLKVVILRWFASEPRYFECCFFLLYLDGQSSSFRTSSLGKLPVECTNRAERGLQKTLGVKNLDPKKHIVWKIGQSVGFKYVHHFLRTSCWWNHPSCWWIHPSSGTRGLWLRRRGLDWCNIDHGLKKLLGMFGRNTGKSMGLVCGLCVVSLMMVSCTWPWKKMESYEVMIIFRSQMPMT